MSIQKMIIIILLLLMIVVPAILLFTIFFNGANPNNGLINVDITPTWNALNVIKIEPILYSGYVISWGFILFITFSIICSILAIAKLRG